MGGGKSQKKEEGGRRKLGQGFGKPKPRAGMLPARAPRGAKVRRSCEKGGRRKEPAFAKATAGLREVWTACGAMGNVQWAMGNGQCAMCNAWLKATTEYTETASPARKG